MGGVKSQRRRQNVDSSRDGSDGISRWKKGLLTEKHKGPLEVDNSKEMDSPLRVPGRNWPC
jgi:hypothetical protein